MNIWDEKNSTEPKMNSNGCTSSISKVITNETKNDSEKSVCENTGWIRNCPKCNKIVVHKNERSYKRSVEKKKVCKSCKQTVVKRSAKTIEKCRNSRRLADFDVLTRICPKCDKLLKYKNVNYRREADKKKKLCMRCVQIRGPKPVYFRTCGKCGKKIMCGRYLKDNTKPCKRCSRIGKKTNDKTKLKLRHAFINNMVATGQYYHPSYNKKACKYFDVLNKTMGWRGRHALDGGELFVKDTNYWVDYYEPNLNLVIEWDEPKHNRTKNKEKDIVRQEAIIEKLKCSFYRIEQKTGKITKVAGDDFTLTNPLN